MTIKVLTVADFKNLAKNRKGKFLRNGHMIHPTVVYEYKKMNGDFRDIVTDPTLHRPQYFNAKWVEKEREENLNSFFNRPFNDDPQARSHVRVYDINNKGWRTLRTWNIVTEVEQENPLLANWPEEWNQVQDELLKSVERKKKREDQHFYEKINIIKVKINMHKELLRKAGITNANWANKYFKSVKENQRIVKEIRELLDQTYLWQKLKISELELSCS